MIEVDDLAAAVRQQRVPELVRLDGAGAVYRSSTAPEYDARHAAAWLPLVRVPVWVPTAPVFLAGDGGDSA